MLPIRSSFQALLEPEEDSVKTNPLTKVICTLGPASESPEVIQGLVDAGVRGFRIDLAWAGVDWIRATLAHLRAAEAAAATHTAVILDTIGPEIRVRSPPAAAAADGDAAGVTFAAGSAVTLDRTAAATLSPSTLPIDCSQPFTALAIERGSVLHVSSYLTAGADLTTLSLEVAAVTADRVECRARLSCTLPLTMKLTVHGGGVHTHMPILSDDDKAKISALPPSEAQYLNVSYCRNAADIASVREFLEGAGLAHVKVMAKVCTPDAVVAAREIIAAADGVVLGRGTLGLELPAEKVFYAQKACLRAANLAGKLAVVTRVVDTMVHAPRPTRAEATDVANLVLDGADAITLGAETFRGEHPVQAALTVLAICRQAEAVYDAAAFYNRLMDEHGGFREANLSKTEALASSAVRATTKLEAPLVIAFTKTGRTPGLLAKYRAKSPILTVVAAGAPGSPDVRVIVRQCALLRGVIPVLCKPHSDGQMAVDGSLTDWALGIAQGKGLVKNGDRVVVSQCPRILPDGLFEEAAVVKFIIVGEQTPKQLPRCGSCFDVASNREGRACMPGRADSTALA